MKKLDRLEYLLHMAISALVAAIAYTIYTDAMMPEYVIVMAMVTYVSAIGWQIYAILGRLTDLNMTKWAILLFIVPIANIILAFYLLFGRGYDVKHGVKLQTGTVTP